jgi:hypothetical protein
MFRRVLLLGASFAALCLPLDAMAATLQWNLSSDFRTVPNQANPNPDSLGNPSVWHFLTSDSLERNPDDYRPLTEFTSNAFDISGLEQWQDPDNLLPNNRVPQVGINATGKSQFYISLDWPNEVVRLHPYVDQLAIVGWQSPIDGAVKVQGAFGDMDANGGNGVLWFIDQSNRTLASGHVNGSSDGFSLDSILVRNGDFIYFAVDPDGEDFSFDSTSADINIAAVPLPLNLSLIAAAIAAILAVGWRRGRFLPHAYPAD